MSAESVCPGRVYCLNGVADGPSRLDGLADSVCLVHDFRILARANKSAA
jgi:hypothetical protein